MDFIDKKEKLADLIEKYIEDNDNYELNENHELLIFAKELLVDIDFKSHELFTNIINELINYSGELSRKELKQRALMIRSYLY